MTQIKLSASRTKTFTSCSWLYYARYCLKIADLPNTGAAKGSICHVVFEMLLDKRHSKYVETIMGHPATIKNVPAVERLVRKHMKAAKLADSEFDHIDTMILVGLATDFLCNGGDLMAPEQQFDLKSDNPKYVITGLIDKTAKYKDRFIRIVDYKSSKQKFEGDDLKLNVQALMYSLAAKRLWPHLTPVVDFVFLQFPEKPIERLKFSDQDLKGFEHFLADIYKQMETFTYKDALKNMAGRQKMPGKGEGFKGPLMCGFAKTKGQLKKDGNPMWACSYKFPFTYWKLCDADGGLIKTSRIEGELVPKIEKGEFVVRDEYKGCPCWVKQK